MSSKKDKRETKPEKPGTNAPASLEMTDGDVTRPARKGGSRYLHVELSATPTGGCAIVCTVDEDTFGASAVMKTKVTHLLASAAALLSGLPAPEGVPTSVEMSVTMEAMRPLSKGEVLKAFDG